ncbi:MAG: sigma 54-interacting transcriptional regulator [Hespellia sp.]|nr:sigma 54-interacting transcriptional regulator [Hespellia sp.]
MSADNRYKLLFLQLLEKSEDAFIVVDQNGIITDINKQYCKFLAKKKEDVIGKPIEDVISTTTMYDVLKQGYLGDNTEEIYFHPYVSEDTDADYDTYGIGNRFCIFDEENNIIGAMAQVKFKDRFLDVSTRIIQAETEFYHSEFTRSLSKDNAFETIIGNASQITELKKKGTKIAKKDFTVLITGETGTGKELLAKAIHMESPRSDKPLISINCGSIPADLIESELFGYEEGAFTGAKKGGKIGKFLMANHGSIFLDEIGDLPLPLQVKLLRVLQEQEIDPIGSTHSIPIDVRVISATRQNLPQMIESGQFREDLYYRLAVVTLETVPLREHKNDIILYASHFLEKLNQKYKTSIILSDSVKKCFAKYDWPGNVRELQNVISSAYAICDPPSITLADLPSKIASAHIHNLDEKENTPSKLKDLMNTYEASLIIESLQRNQNNISETARDLGIERSLLHKKIKKLNIVVQKTIGVQRP